MASSQDYIKLVSQLDPAQVTALDNGIQALFDAMSDPVNIWHLKRGDKTSPPLPEPVREAIASAYYQQVLHFVQASKAPEHDLSFTALPQQELKQVLERSPVIISREDRAEVVKQLVGTVIRQSIDTAKILGIPQADLVVNPELLGIPNSRRM